jgi:hypothetical protein
MNYYKIPAEQLEQNLNDVLKMTGDTFSQHDAKLPVVGSLFSQRKIKFRGQTIGGFWVYGNLSLLPKRVKNIEAGSYISNAAGLPFAYNVRPETVTQFTGLKDKNGKEIYEGDILSLWYSRDTTGKDIVRFNHVVAWEDTNGFSGWNIPFLESAEIIGNVFENPELAE